MPTICSKRICREYNFTWYWSCQANDNLLSNKVFICGPRTNDLKVEEVDNLFCAGEKSGLFVGHTEAICTGTLAGHNAVRLVMGIPLLILPSSLAIGDIIAFENEQARTSEGRKLRYTFAGSIYFNRMKALGLYTMDVKEIENRVAKLNLDGVFDQKLC